MNKQVKNPERQSAAPVEEYVNMPLKPEVKSALKERAAANGRPAGREAAAIVTKSVMRGRTTAAL